jgi:hypothetical protein
MPNHIRLPKLAVGLITAPVAILLAAGCAHNSSSPAPAAPAAPTISAAAPTSAPFQPFVLVNTPAPVSQASTHRHRYLHLAQRAGHTYLADPDGRYYEAGRDEAGRLYPVYHDQATNQYYPLFYDSSSDQYYRVLHTDDGNYYRCYVGDSSSRFYETDDTYASNVPPPSDCPIVTDSYNTTNNYYGDGSDNDNGYDNYAPQISSGNSHRDAWLWAVPVIVGAYLLLSQHHHSNPQPVYYVQPSGYNPVIVQQINIVNPINSPVTVYQNGQYVTYSEAVTPPSGCSPIYYGTPPRQPYPLPQAIPAGRTRVWRASGFNVTNPPPNAQAYPTAVAFDQARAQGAPPPPIFHQHSGTMASQGGFGQPPTPPTFTHSPPGAPNPGRTYAPPNPTPPSQTIAGSAPGQAQHHRHQPTAPTVTASSPGSGAPIRTPSAPSRPFRIHPITAVATHIPARSNYALPPAQGRPTVRHHSQMWPTAIQPRNQNYGSPTPGRAISPVQPAHHVVRQAPTYPPARRSPPPVQVRTPMPSQRAAPSAQIQTQPRRAPTEMAPPPRQLPPAQGQSVVRHPAPAPPVAAKPPAHKPPLPPKKPTIPPGAATPNQPNT